MAFGLMSVVDGDESMGRFECWRSKMDVNEDRIAALKEKLAAREGRPGFTDNVEALKAEIAKLEAEDAQEESKG